MAIGSEDVRYMAAALRLGRRGMGRVHPNPAVGCLIVQQRNGYSEIVGRGWTMPGGRPHAEAVALAEAGERARGATAYVTLEPCAHQGRAGPCADALAAAGISRLVTALGDPDPRTAGDGHARLREASAAVEGGVLEAMARFDHLGHVLRMTQGRPFVQLKLAHSREGYIATARRKPVRITGAISDNWVHRMRAQADAILVGAGTVRSDDPMLTCRLPGAESRSPVRVVLDTDLSLPIRSKLVETAREVPVLAACAEDADTGREAALRGRGVEIVKVPLDEESRLDLDGVLRELGAHGFTRLLVEGGGEVARAFVDCGLVDEVLLIEGDVEIGRDGYPAFATAGPDYIDDCGSLRLAETFSLGEDRVRRYVRAE